MLGKYQCPICGTGLGYKGLCWKCKAEQKRKEVLNWSQEEIEEKIQNLIENADQLDDYGTQEYEDACNLIEFRGICPPQLQRAALKAEVFSLEKIYYHAPEDVREGLIERLLAAKDSMDASALMECLAMQGDEKALETLLELERNPRPWRKKLYVDPSVYAQCGGWTFDKEGHRRTLNFEECYPMVKTKDQSEKAKSPVRIGKIRKDTCPDCGGKIADMLVVDGRDERLKFLGVEGIITATCCPNCVPYTDASFSRYTLDGGSQPLSSKLILDKVENYIGEEEYDQVFANDYILGKEQVPPFYGEGSEDLNTIGGFANWVQDWQYTLCPDCGKQMKYLGQIQWDTIVGGEGTLYIEFCPDCQIASMHHQQT